MLLISNGISTAICTDRLSLKLWRREGGGERVEERGWRREGGGERVEERGTEEEVERGGENDMLYAHLYLGSSVTGLP